MITKLLTTVTILMLIICNVIFLFQLSTTNNQLLITINQLSTTETELYTSKAELVNTEQWLDATNAQLANTVSKLANTEFQLDNTKVILADTEAQLETTAVQLSTTQAQLQKTAGQLTTVETKLETSKDKQIQMLNQYSDMREQINIRAGQGQDIQKFITPDNSLVSAKVQEVAGNYSQDISELWRDYKRMYHWVVSNVTYSYDSQIPVIPEVMGDSLVWEKDYWRMPEETLEDEVGDCEDMAVLLVSMMLSYNNEGFAVWALGIANESAGHLAVAFPVQGNELAILDPTGNYYSGYPGAFRSYDVAASINKWLSHWAREIPGAEINLVFSNEIYQQFTDSEDFVKWVSER